GGGAGAPAEPGGDRPGGGELPAEGRPAERGPATGRGDRPGGVPATDGQSRDGRTGGPGRDEPRRAGELDPGQRSSGGGAAGHAPEPRGATPDTDDRPGSELRAAERPRGLTASSFQPASQDDLAPSGALARYTANIA